MRRTLCAIMLPVGLGLGLLAGCGDSGDGDGSTTVATSTPAGSGTTAPSRGEEGSGASLEAALRAVAATERRVDGGRVYDIEREGRGDDRHWEVEVAGDNDRAFTIDVRADGREVVSMRERSRPGDDARKVASAKVTLQQALRTAGGRADGATFDEAEIDRSGGRIVWKVEFEGPGDREVKVVVDADSGAVRDVTRQTD